MLSQVENKSGSEPSTTTSTTNCDPTNVAGDKAVERQEKSDINKLSEEHKIGEQEEQKVSQFVEYKRFGTVIPNRGAAAHKGAVRKCRGAAKYWFFSLFVNAYY